MNLLDGNERFVTGFDFGDEDYKSVVRAVRKCICFKKIKDKAAK